VRLEAEVVTVTDTEVAGAVHHNNGLLIAVMLKRRLSKQLKAARSRIEHRRSSNLSSDSVSDFSLGGHPLGNPRMSLDSESSSIGGYQDSVHPFSPSSLQNSLDWSQTQNSESRSRKGSAARVDSIDEGEEGSHADDDDDDDDDESSDRYSANEMFNGERKRMSTSVQPLPSFDEKSESVSQQLIGSTDDDDDDIVDPLGSSGDFATFDSRMIAGKRKESTKYSGTKLDIKLSQVDDFTELEPTIASMKLQNQTPGIESDGPTNKLLARMMTRNSSSLSYHSPNNAAAQANAEAKIGTDTTKQKSKKDDSDSEEEDVCAFTIDDLKVEAPKRISGYRRGSVGRFRAETEFSDEDVADLDNFMADEAVPTMPEYNLEVLKYLKCKPENENKTLGIKSGTSIQQGDCPYMEDRILSAAEISTDKSTTSNVGIFGILDGHNGSTCVDFVLGNLVSEITSNDNIKSGNQAGDVLAIKQSFSNLDQAFLDASKTKEPLETSGSCATIVLCRRDIITVAWAGDCRALVCKDDGTAEQLTKDHRPSNESEADRVRLAGGWIANKRVCGLIAVTRSFGDIEFKTLKNESWGKTFAADLLISEPETATIDAGGGKYRFIVLASDGLFESLDNQRVVDIVSASLMDFKDVDMAAEVVMEEARANAMSLENCSVQVIVFGCAKTGTTPLLSPVTTNIGAKSPKVTVQSPVNKVGDDLDDLGI
jgi:serine/threonine protein phosphatase PrpC